MHSKIIKIEGQVDQMIFQTSSEAIEVTKEWVINNCEVLNKITYTDNITLAGGTLNDLQQQVTLEPSL